MVAIIMFVRATGVRVWGHQGLLGLRQDLEGKGAQGQAVRHSPLHTCLSNASPQHLVAEEQSLRRLRMWG